MSWHVLDVGIVFKAIPFVLLVDFSVDVRFYEYFLHLVSQSNHKSPAAKLVVAFLASLPFIVQDDVVFGLMLEGKDVGVGLEGEELGGRDDQSAVVGGVQEIELRGDFDAEEEGGAAQRFRPLGVHQQQVILAYLRNDEGVGGLHVAGVIPLVLADELRAGLTAHWEMVLNESETPMGVLLVPEEEVEALVCCLHANGLFSPLLPDQVLLQRQESAFMGGVLSDLNQSIPVMGSKVFLAIGALRILFHEFHNFALLDTCVFVDGAGVLDFDFDSFGMGLCPYKLGILQFQLAETLHFLQQNAQQFSAFSFAIDPRRPLVPIAIGAKELLFSC